jgi:integrase
VGPARGVYSSLRSPLPIKALESTHTLKRMSAMSAPPALRPIPWARFRDEVLKLYRPPSRRPGTRQKTDQVLREFGGLCRTTADLELVTIADWIEAHPGRAPAYLDGLLRSLSAVCTYGAHPRRRYLWDPFEERPVSSWLPADEREEASADPWPRHRSAEEVRRVLAGADSEALHGDWKAHRDRAAVYALAFSGAHKSEVLGLRIRDIDLPRGVISFRSHPRRRLKSGARAAVLPIAPALLPVLEDYLPRIAAQFPRGEFAFPHHFGTGPWLSGRPGHRPLDRIRALGERAGVRGLTIDAFRHTVATLSEGWDIGELALQRILRHARRSTQLHYRHPDLALMRDAVARIRF